MSTVYTPVRLPKALRERLEEVAKAKGKTLSAQIIEVLSRDGVSAVGDPIPRVIVQGARAREAPVSCTHPKEERNQLGYITLCKVCGSRVR
jgi:hypothetical protein